MSKMNLKDTLFSLCRADGTSGSEKSIAALGAALLEQYMPCHTDALGNVIGIADGSGPRILLDAHMDRIGLVVTSVDEKGFLHVAKVGGVDTRVLSAAEVTVWGKQKLFGVVASVPPHLAGKDDEKAPDMDSVFIDVGLSADEAKELVRPGDRVTIEGTQRQLMGDRVVSPAVDDRAGMVVILRCLEILKEKGITPNLTVMFSAQEETGGSGAAAGSFANHPDEAVAVDVGFARAPGIKDEKAGKLGGGPLIGFAPALDYAMSNLFLALADENNIPWQHDVMGGRTGTNGDDIQISAGGVRTGLLSIPIRNMHTAAEVVSLGDIEATACLLAAYIGERSGKRAE